MDLEVKTTDSKGRVTLRKEFARAQVVLEHVSPTEIRIRKAVVIPESELRFYEEGAAPLSDRDRDVFLDLLDDPPEPNDALRRALSRYADA